MLLPKLTMRFWLAGTGKPGPVCAVAAPSAAARVKVVLVVLVNMLSDEIE